MNNTQVAHLWASRNRESAKRSNFFFDGDTIYSYGSHFPIARWVGDAVLFTTKGYSSSTSRHMLYAKRAIPSETKVFNVENVRDERPELRVEEYMFRIRDAFESAKRARTPWKHENAVRLVEEFHDYCTHFSLPYPFEGTEMDEVVEKSREKIAALNAERAESERKELQERKEKAQTSVAGFLAGIDCVNANLYDIPPIMRSVMRGDVKTVQTSHGAEVEYSKAQRSFNFIREVWDSGVNWKRNGHTHHVGNFSLEWVLSETVCIGCHVFERSEVERFAKQEGWM